MTARTLHARLHLLDRQVVRAADGRLLCKVDDLELADDGAGRPYVIAILAGPLALGPRIGGPVGRLMVGATRLFRTEEDPAPQRIAMGLVSEIGSAVEVGGDVPEAALERWVRDRVIDPIPGSGGDPDAREPGGARVTDLPARPRLSTLIGSPVLGLRGDPIGQVADVQLTQDGPLLHENRQALRLTGLIVTPRHTGQLFGYERGPGGRSPAPIRVLILRLHRGSRFVSWDQIDALGDPVRLSVPSDSLVPLREFLEPTGS